MKKYSIEGFSFVTHVGRNQLSRTGLSLGAPSCACILADQKLSSKALVLEKSLLRQGWKVKKLLFRVDESLKSTENVSKIYSWLTRNQVDRSSVLFAMGGGVMGDWVGFVAGTYLRGVRWVSIPTTLLAQVDSGVGGKTGINLPEGKNLIGMIHHPSEVICDTGFLETLSQRDLVSGLGEMIKYALLFSPAFLKQIESTTSPFTLKKLNSDFLAKMIPLCLEWKIKTVKKDPYDVLGKREILNFGHTLGHALESLTEYTYFRHGEAVIWGMRGACALSRLKGLLAEKDFERLEKILGHIPVPPLPEDIQGSAWIKKTKLDKKFKSKKSRYVLLEGIGKPRVGVECSDEEVKAALCTLMEKSQ